MDNFLDVVKMSRFKLPLVEQKPASFADASMLQEGAVPVEQPGQQVKPQGITISDEKRSFQAPEISAERKQLDELQQRLEQLQVENEEYRSGLQKLEQQARDMGYRQGLDSMQQDFATELERLTGLFEQVGADLQMALSMIHDKIASVVIEANNKILGKQLVDKKIALEVVQEVIRKAGYQENMVVKVSPSDHELLNKYRMRHAPAKNIEFISDERVKLGGCIVNTDSGMLDGRLEVQLQALYEVLRGVHGHGSGG